MKRATLTFISLLFTFNLFAQEFDLPKYYNFEKVEDYARYEQDILNCVNWLLTCPITDHELKRREANKFLMQWISGSPSVHLTIKPEIVSFMSTSPGLLSIFISGWTKHALETRDVDNLVAANLAGIESVIDYYTKNKKFLMRDKHIEKYIKLQEKGELQAFIEKNA